MQHTITHYIPEASVIKVLQLLEHDNLNVLVKKEGIEVFTQDVPKLADEIEIIMAG